jgi:hypothetical protein
MNVMLKAILAVCLFLGAWLCIYGYQAQKLIKISHLWSAIVALACAATFVYFAFIDIRKQ